MAKDTSKKRKRDDLQPDNHHQPSLASAIVDTSKPTAIFEPTKVRRHTLTVAIPGSIIANAQTHDQKTHLAGQLARALAVFCVDEIVIFDDGTSIAPPSSSFHHNSNSNYHNDNARTKAQLAAQDEATGYSAFSDPADFLFHVLSYLETPPYLRRALFPHHPNLRTAGALPSLDMPHHLKAEEWCQYREGVTLSSGTDEGGGESVGSLNGQGDTPSKQFKKKQSSMAVTSAVTTTTLVSVGFPNPVTIATPIPPNTRVTLRFESATKPPSTAHLGATAVSPDAPREDAGYYWGYVPRRAASLSAVFTESPYDGGYDYSIGTSERGVPLQQFLESVQQKSEDGTTTTTTTDGGTIPTWRHLLIVFGGVAGLEKALQGDPELRGKMGNVSELFDAWVNLLPGQGSRTIRTEEAVWIGLMGLRETIWGGEEK